MALSEIGIFGGTFDPVHLGHLIVAEEVGIKLRLEKVIFVPAGEPWMKAGQVITPATHRIAMLRRALRGNPYFKLSTIEVERPGPSYTVETMTIFKQKFGAETKLYFILGSDALSELPCWKEPAQLLEICQLVAFANPGLPVLSLATLDSQVPGVRSRVIWVEVPQIEISSSQIRQRQADGLSIRYLVPQAVEKYILANKLYLGNT
jgi:nicotinate-nucleotide adenylyltransferase